ncbi:MAG TPA: hypothetical protein ENI45_00410, partial [Thermoplasmatales archaeon]|nr:hypothetical protein [Thermoplasmatales archaeon]
TSSFGLGNLVIGVYTDLGSSTTENRIAYVSLSPDKVSRNGGWVHVEFTKILNYDKTYYIVVYQDGGNERSYYKWYYGNGDPYNRGVSYSTDTYPWDWEEDSGKDFCFRTYGESTGDEPDGVVERWAVLVGVLENQWGEITYYADEDVYDMRDVLVHHGWQSDHIKTLVSPRRASIRSAIKWLDSMDDGDDIIVLVVRAHGGIDVNNGKGGITAYDGVFYYYQMDELLDECDAEGIFVLIHSCKSGSAIPDMAQEGRVILTSCTRYQPSYWDDEMTSGMFMYFFLDETGIWSSRHG